MSEGLVAMTLTVKSWLAERHVRPETAPAVLADLMHAVGDVDPSNLSRNDPPAVEVAERQAAVALQPTPEG
jgi:hypothetical protein